MLRISPDLRVTDFARAAVGGILDARYDSSSGRFVFCHANHLSFRSECLQERYRLYLLGNGGALIHVPYPEICRHGGNENHPGYFRYEKPGAVTTSVESTDLALEVFEVLDRAGCPIDEREACRRYLSVFFRDDLVGTALADYESFVEIIGWSRARKKTDRKRPALLPEWRDRL